MELAAERSDDLGQPPLDRHVDVLVVVLERERAGLDLVRDGRQGRPRSAAARPRRGRRPGAGPARGPSTARCRTGASRRSKPIEALSRTKSGSGWSPKHACGPVYGPGRLAARERAARIRGGRGGESRLRARVQSSEGVRKIAGHRSNGQGGQRGRPRWSTAATTSSRWFATSPRHATSCRPDLKLAGGSVTDRNPCARAAKGAGRRLELPRAVPAVVRRPGDLPTDDDTGGSRQCDRRRAAPPGPRPIIHTSSLERVPRRLLERQ